MKEQWIVKLRHRVRDENSVKAPEGLLDDIKHAISERGMGPVTSPKAGKAIGRRWMYRMASVAALLAIGMFVYELSQLPQTTPSPTGKAVDIARLADIGRSVMEERERTACAQGGGSGIGQKDCAYACTAGG